MGKGKYLTPEEAARKINKTVPWIMERIRQGKLDAKLEVGMWLIL